MCPPAAIVRQSGGWLSLRSIRPRKEGANQNVPCFYPIEVAIAPEIRLSVARLSLSRTRQSFNGDRKSIAEQLPLPQFFFFEALRCSASRQRCNKSQPLITYAPRGIPQPKPSRAIDWIEERKGEQTFFV